MDEEYGKKIYELLVGVVVVGGVVGLIWLINLYRKEPAGEPAESCASRLNTLVSLERSGDKSGSINSLMDEFGASCGAEYDVFVGYVQMKGFYEADASGPCGQYRMHFKPAAIQLAREDGFCGPHLRR